MSKKDKKRPKGSLSKVKLAILVGIIVIAFASIAFFLLLQLTSTETAIENDEGQKDEKVVALERASKAAEEGDTTEVKKQYRTLIDAESDIERKTVMMIDWSGVLYAAGYHQEAIAVAKEAESLNEDRFLVADWLSRVYEYEKKYDQSVKYYLLAGELADSPMNNLGFDKAHYDAEAARVKALDK
jgi:tetratricopeptide (TPR) repeat protein|tara:strand:- start:1262 stop:1816 length:555 start_codon:yes stop_codon:yes gene_type:complete